VSPYADFVSRWQGCTGCELHAGRSYVVLARGTVPCDVLLVGEGPGHSEDTLGLPFCGSAGFLLDRIVERSLDNYEAATGRARPSVAFTNLVCCLPVGEDDAKATEPPVDAIRSCSHRLREFVELCQPRLVVAVGKLAETYLDGKLLGSVWHSESKRGRRLSMYAQGRHAGSEIPRCAILHPAAILRQLEVQRGLSVQRCVVTLTNAMEEFLT
jgi:uracil-DNA glycosylase